MENIPLLNEIWTNFSEAFKGLIPLFIIVFDFFVAWWWIIVPLILFPEVKKQWLFWRITSRNDESVILEVVIPNEMEKPIRAMENVIVGFWPLYGPPGWYDKWWKGKTEAGFSLEMVSLGGVPHFLVRCPKDDRNLFETNIYAEYPEAEIYEVEDYTKKVPFDIPNEKWDLWGTDFYIPGNDVYPLKTYRDFETEKETKEEKRIDPIVSLVEGFSKLGKDEQMWILISATPVSASDIDFAKRADKEIEKIAGRKEKPKPMGIIADVFNTLTGFPPKKEVKEEDALPEMKLVSGEKNKISAIEDKKSKHLYECFFRFVYLGKRESFSGGMVKIPIGYVNQFNKHNALVPWKETITKVPRNWYNWFWFVERRAYTKKRKVFRNYLRRVSAFFPKGKKKETFILNSEELASLYHFPSRYSSPSSSVSRVDAKKKEPPSNLPVEDE
jgi:hypothetical protein